jgi:transcriptional regulator with XRE-family HTH domain
MPKKHSSDLPIRFGVAVKKRRLDHGWTQDKLAERAGLDRSFVSGIERGTRTVSIVTLEKIADAFRTTMAELIKDL